MGSALLSFASIHYFLFKLVTYHIRKQFDKHIFMMKGVLIFAALCAVFVGTSVSSHTLKTTYNTKNHKKIIGCYWGTWAYYRPGYGKFDIDNIDTSLCTHGFYGFADLNNNTADPHVWELVAYDPWYDQAPDDCNEWANNCDPNGDGSICCHYDSYRRFVALKDSNPEFVPMLSIGGWNAGSKKFSQMAADPAKRQIFLDSIIPFVKKYGFEGIDMDWEYPGSRDTIDEDGDKENFSELCKMMAELLHEHDLLFTAALSPGKNTIENAYDIPEISKHLDYLNVMTYDYHGWWENNSHPFTGHNAPLYGREEEEMEDSPGYMFSVFDTLKIWLDAGAPPEKTLMGFAQYGRGMTLEFPEENGLYCPAKDGIPAGPYTQQDGIWGYLEILQAFNNDTLINLPGATPHGWTSVTDDCYDAPYAYNGPYWISYDDEDSVALKTKYANLLGLAGMFGWSIETDDFEGRYHDQPYPLLRKVNEVVASGETYDPENPKCEGTAPICPELFPSTTTTPKPTTEAAPTTTEAEPETTTTKEHTPNECTEAMEVFPYPGNCHKYYVCVPTDAENIFDIIVMDCDAYVFNPNIESCVDPNLPGNENICPEGH